MAYEPSNAPPAIRSTLLQGIFVSFVIRPYRRFLGVIPHVR